jgi:hypothetical protein
VAPTFWPNIHAGAKNDIRYGILDSFKLDSTGSARSCGLKNWRNRCKNAITDLYEHGCIKRLSSIINSFVVIFNNIRVNYSIDCTWKISDEKRETYHAFPKSVVSNKFFP